MSSAPKVDGGLFSSVILFLLNFEFEKFFRPEEYLVLVGETSLDFWLSFLEDFESGLLLLRFGSVFVTALLVGSLFLK